MASCQVDPPEFQAPKKPTIEAVHHDLDTANAYRMEFIKTLILLCGALFAFSVTFRPELHQPVMLSLFWWSWIALAISMLGGFIQLACWERFYASYQRFEHKDADGKPFRKRITSIRRRALLAQMLAFIVGVGALGTFTALNIERQQPVNSIKSNASPTP